MTLLALVPLGLVAAASAPAGFFLYTTVRTTTRKGRQRINLYEDNDGVADALSEENHTALLSTALGVFAIISGLSTTISTAIQDAKASQLENVCGGRWAALGSWALLLAQALCIYLSRNPTAKYTLGVWGAISSVVIFGIVCVEILNGIHGDFQPRDGTHIIVLLIQLNACVIAALAFLCIPRRPRLYTDARPVDREYTCTVLSRLTFSWAGPILAMARNKERLSLDDLPMISHYMRSRPLLARCGYNSAKRRLWKRLLYLFKWAFLSQFGLTLVTSVSQFGPQYAMYRLLLFLERRQQVTQEGYIMWLWVLGLASSMFFNSVAESQLSWMSWSQLAIPIRALLSILISTKSLRRKDTKGAHKSMHVASGGGLSAAESRLSDSLGEGPALTKDPEITASKKTPNITQGTSNLVAVDSKRVSDFASLCWFFPASTVRLILSVCFLYSLIGWASLLAGLLAWLLTVPINAFVSKRYSNLQGDLMAARDRRLAVLTEALQSIRQIKFCAHESRWRAKISQEREQELAVQWKAFVYQAGLFCLLTSGPLLLSTVALLTYACLHKTLLPSVAFTTIAILGHLEFTLTIIPQLITDAIAAWVSLSRIEEYLNAPETGRYTVDSKSITFQHAFIAWPSDSSDFQTRPLGEYRLRGINLGFPPGELSVVSGPTGSGKSLLLAAILGEVDKLAGHIAIPQALDERFDHKATQDNWIISCLKAYVAQTPFIESATIRDNITFGLPLDQTRYQKTVSVCALTKDLEVFPDGDLTDLGATGINLSGGQRWRISFARALYSRAGILILDDILSSLDSQVGRHIVEEALTSDLAEGRTRILVTHHIDLCRSMTAYAVVLGNGSVEYAGSVEGLNRSPRLKGVTQTDVDENDLIRRTAMEGNSIEELSGDVCHGGYETPTGLVGKKLIEREERETGRIKFKLYQEYILSSGGLTLWMLALVCFLGGISLDIAKTWWISEWTRAYQAQSYPPQHIMHQQIQMQLFVHDLAAQSYTRETWFYLKVYIGLSVLLVVLGTIKYIWAYTASIRASRTIFHQAVGSVLGAPLRWFDTVPLGRILNRFTADFSVLDSRIVNDFAEFLYTLLELVGISIAGFMVSPFMILFACASVVIASFVGSRYLNGTREVKRLESIARSPILELLDHVQTGLATLRAYGRTDEYIDRMHRKIDGYTTALMHMWLFNQWMSLRLNLIASSFTILLAGLIVISNSIDASLAGFALAFALRYNIALIWTVRSYASLEMDMNSTERIIEYTHLDSEDLGGDHLPAGWPSEGSLEVSNLVAGYAPDLPPVLRGISFTAKRERVGIVGRTGAGKSSLTLALFRFLEAREGVISIDGIDISTVRLQDLRDRLAIIPQDPVLFSGTVRTNLDPLDEYTDHQVRAALEKVFPLSNPGGLYNDEGSALGKTNEPTPTAVDANHHVFPSPSFKIFERGLNLSQGQRQLLCFARAILTRPKILILDEATSAVDSARDELVQRSLYTEFQDCTLLVVAHRLSTVANFDRILVMSDGTIIEEGAPKELLELHGSFWEMVDQSGDKGRLERLIYGPSPVGDRAETDVKYRQRPQFG